MMTDDTKEALAEGAKNHGRLSVLYIRAGAGEGKPCAVGMFVGSKHVGWVDLDQFMECAMEVCNALPDTHVIVPVEPTEAMIDAGSKAPQFVDRGDGMFISTPNRIYQAMIKAAQDNAND
jgi:hypothetical protein